MVAGHRFTFELVSSGQARKIPDNYAPFEALDDGDSLFRISAGYICPFERPANAEEVYADVSEPGEPLIGLYSTEDGWWIEMAPVNTVPPVASLRVNKDFTTGTLICSTESMLRFALDNSAMLLFAFKTACLDTLEMHSSVTVKDGKAYMFLAASGTGKSTHSRMWLENVPGSTLLNDDNPIVRILDDGTVRVFGSPWSGKTPCYRNESAELGAMVLIRRSRENKISPLSIPEAYGIIYSSSSGFRPIEEMADGLHSTISAIALKSCCHVLDCRPDAEAAKICSEALCKQ